MILKAERSAPVAERLGYKRHGVAEVRGLYVNMYRIDRAEGDPKLAD